MKMLKSKKGLAVFVSLALILTAFTGCKKADSQVASTADNGPKPALKALVSYKSGLDYNTYTVEKYLEDKTGYKVTYDVLPADNANDKLNAIMASGEAYDFVLVYDKNEYVNFAQQGALLDLEPLVKKYGPNIEKNISSTNFDSVRIGGKYYMIPSMASTGLKGGNGTSIALGVVYRQDLLEKMGDSVPKTIDDFTKLLQDVKDKDPNGQGNKNIPLVAEQTADLSANLLNCSLGGAFGIGTSWVDQNGELVARQQMPGFKEYINYMRGLYSKGLIDKESPMNTGTTAKAKFTSGRAFAFVDGWYDFPTLVETMAKTQPGTKLAYLPAVSGSLGNAVFSVSSPSNSIDNFLMIPKSSNSHAADVIKYVNAKLDEETSKGMVLGTKGVDYTEENGAYMPILPAFVNDRGNANQYTTGVTKNYSKYWLARVKKDDNLNKAFTQLNTDYADMAKIDPSSNMPLAVQADVIQDSTALQNLTNQFVIQSIAGQFSDDAFNKFISQWKSQGGDDMTKKLNDWYKTAKNK